MGFFDLLPLVAIFLFLSVSVFASRSPSYFLFLIVSPCAIYTLLLPSLGVSTSVASRLTFMAIVGTPVIFGYLGLLKIGSEVPSVDSRRGNSTNYYIGFLLFFQFCLNFISVFMSRPINGVGQSVFIPIFTVVISALSIALVSWERVKLKNLQVAAEYLLIILYLFLLVNIFYPVLIWSHELSESLIFSKDGYRFSPFSKILNTPGRQSFFETDPEKFAIFSFVAFVVLLASASVARKSIGISLVVIIGSTTQSRLFYVGIFTIILIFLSDKITDGSKFLRGLIFSTLLVGNLLITPLLASSNATGLSSFSGRTYIWKIILENWDRQSKFLGHFGAYSLSQFSKTVESKLTFFHAHNLVLQYLWDWGILGLVVVISLLLAFMKIGLEMTSPGYLILCAIFIIGFIEPSLVLSLKSITFLSVLLLIKCSGRSLKLEKRIEK